MNKLLDWFKINHMKVNENKFQYIVFLQKQNYQ